MTDTQIERDVQMGLGGDRVHLWATDADDAKGVASRVLGIPVHLVEAHWSGLTRPGSYDIEGNPIDGETENTGRSMRRYTVKAGK